MAKNIRVLQVNNKEPDDKNIIWLKPDPYADEFSLTPLIYLNGGWRALAMSDTEIIKILIAEHNESEDSHTDIREAIKDLDSRLDTTGGINIFSSQEDLDNYLIDKDNVVIGGLVTVIGDNSIVYQVQEDFSLVAISSQQFVIDISNSPMAINHNLGFYPKVVVIDNDSKVVECSVVHSTVNQVRVEWNGDLTGGKLIIN